MFKGSKILFQIGEINVQGIKHFVRDRENFEIEGSERVHCILIRKKFFPRIIHKKSIISIFYPLKLNKKEVSIPKFQVGHAPSCYVCS